MKAFWGAFGGWLAGQLFLGGLFWSLGAPTFADSLVLSLAAGGFGTCLGACITAGRDRVPAFGCLSYLALWGVLILGGVQAIVVLGLPGMLVAITAITGALTGFWLMGDGPLSPLLLLFLLLFSWVYGALSLFAPPAIFTLKNLVLTLGMLVGFQLAHVVLARLLRPRRKK